MPTSPDLAIFMRTTIDYFTPCDDHNYNVISADEESLDFTFSQLKRGIYYSVLFREGEPWDPLTCFPPLKTAIYNIC